MRGKNTTGQTWAKWGISLVALLVLMAITAGASSAMRFGNSSPRHFTAAQEKSKSTVRPVAVGYPRGLLLERQSTGLGLPSFLNWADSSRRFMADKVVICHSTSSDSNPYSRIISAGTAGHDPSQGTHDLDLFGPPGDETFQCPGLLGITKVCTGGVTGSFTLHITNTYNAADATRTITCAQRIRFPVLRGTVTITEDVPANVVATFGGDCTQDSASSGHTSIGASTDDPDIGESKECSVTNSPTPTTMAVSKSCPNGADASGDLFNVVINGTPTATNLACGGSHTFTVSPGAVTVTEGAAGTTTLSNYTQSSSGCTATLAQGGSGSCTLTNTLKAKQELKVVKSCPNGADAAGDRFNVVINGTATSVNLACGENNVFTDLSGTVTVTEAAAGTTTLSNYTQSSSGCTSVALVRGGSQVTCTLTNTLKAKQELKVVKSCPNGADAAGDRFNVVINGTATSVNLACGENNVFTDLSGTVTVTEAAAGTTTLSNYTQSSSGCTSVALVRGGSQVTCTLTNTLVDLPTVVVTKDCEPNAGADADDRFQFTNNGDNVPADPVACEGSRTITLEPGAAFNFDEVAGNGTTTLADYTKTRSSGCTDSNGLQRGETGSCTITNTLKALPTVTVTKNCAPDAGADADDRFQVTNNGNNTNDPPLACEGSLVLTLQRGAAFDIDEVAGNATTDLGNYTETRSAGCTDADGLQRGATGSCTITNTLKAAPKVTVTKLCPNGAAGSGDRFQAKLDGQDTGDPLACAGSLDVSVTPGAAYAITEGAAGTTDLANYTSSLSEDCSGTLANFGDTATCTITNTLKDAPKLTVNKVCPNGKANDGDRFQVKRNGTNVGAALDCGSETNDSTDVTVTAGVAYTITEGAAGTADLANYTTTFGEGCSGTLEHFGDTGTCTITNTLKAAPKLTVIKHVVNDNGGTASAGNFTLTVTGSSPSPASFAGSEAGTVVTLQPGPYAVNEAAVSGYSTTKAASCAGSLIHFGDTATCTVTNDDIAAPPPPPPPAGVPEIDLAITKADSPDPVSVGAFLTYTLTVTNKKGDTANNVVVTDSLPSAVTFVSVSSTKGTCSGTNPVVCNVGTVAFNELVSIMIVVRPTNPGTVVNTAVVTGREHEHDPADNTATATTLVQGAFVPPSVCYALTVTPRTLTVGRRTIVNVLVREAGKPVKGVRVVITGRGLSKRATTNASGRARFVIVGRSPGILQIRVPSHATCRTQRIGVLGVFTPPVTG